MKRGTFAVWCALPIGLLAAHGRAAIGDDARPAADRLVQAALAAEVAGDATRRAELLAEALRVDPESTSARWHSGQVRYDDQWRTLAEVESLAAQDARRAEYDALRLEAEDTSHEHRDLARWCDRVGLSGRARYHWLRIMADDPYDAEAQKALGLYEYEDGLYSSDEIAAKKSAAKQARDDFERYSPIFTQWLREAAGPATDVRAEALRKIAEVTDPAALAALGWATVERAAAKRGPLGKLPRAKADELRKDLALAVVEAMDGMPQHDATLRLAEHAVFSNWPEVRRKAAEALRPRPSTDYVPLLMGALTTPVAVSVDVAPIHEGLIMWETVRRSGAEADFAQTRSTTFRTIRLNQRGWRDFTNAYLAKASGMAAQTHANAMAANEDVAELNERVFATLQITTDGLVRGDEPQVFWQAWQDYNELATSERPLFEDSLASEFETYTVSCFLAGTPVWTDAGLMAIEQIVPGDLVLAQHPETGELAYQPVLQTTIRPPSRLVSIEAGGDTIVATRGHRFWVDGQGWEMAKFLKPAMRLHAIEGGVGVAIVEEFAEGETLEAYNLVVDGFHTYFVGQSKLLVCDSSCPRPTLVQTPGLLRATCGQELIAADNDGQR